LFRLQSYHLDLKISEVLAFDNTNDAKEHVAFVKENVIGTENVRCDCRDQLEGALTTIEKKD
jgi:GTP cyclohydrolase II